MIWNTICFCFLFPKSVRHHVQVVYIVFELLQNLNDKKKTICIYKRRMGAHGASEEHIVVAHIDLNLSIYCIGFHRSNNIKNVSIMLFCFVSFCSTHSVTFRCIYLSSLSFLYVLYNIKYLSIRAYAILY